ncbi:leucyl aminopeptidase [Alkalilimnicola sp. S0819]|uniref:leucyl aminopeptidase n=1 Tax=Alkalilimnicola sp. S0819 TaxID=2613922 RepID=UPI0012619B2F|nr:leucyl aminopeptidase [Alkalilimnicola sp. S0819]KAB7628338.1 leucyl aminopeptidase [Alkalilimnicola sp. S0819]MPQ15237.1 leucyl aminopeptidase [Alkalilimnicola sp. S0819]
MQFAVKSGSPEKQRSACVVAGVFESRRLSAAAKALDEASGGHLSALLRRGDMEGRAGQALMLHGVPQLLADRVLLIGCGKEREFDERAYRRSIDLMTDQLNDSGATEAVCYLTELPVKGRDLHWCVQDAARQITHRLYRFDDYKSKAEAPRRPVKRLTFAVPSRRDLASGEQAARTGQAVAEGMNLARTLGNTPPNVCYPEYLAEQGRLLAEQYPVIETEVLDVAQMTELGMHSLLAVGRGSEREPRLIVMQYRGGKPNEKPIALVGKGITFDSGGISLKPGAGMDEMKFDMCGSASVFGTLKTCAELELPLNVVAVVAAAENMPDGRATRPGDIVTTMAGKTVEILNTDAEGRLVLCDALTYVERFEPEAVVDIATLTGACVIALGNHAHGLLGNHSPLINELLGAGKASGDRAWELPLWDEYQDQLKSNFADLANIGGREAGTITAACFLSRFAGKFHWAHLDIAGTAWLSGANKGATGRPVPLLSQFLIQRAER